jgi:hypothetical protein
MALSDAQQAAIAIAAAIKEFGSNVVRTRPKRKLTNGSWQAESTATLTCMAQLLVSNPYPGAVNPFGMSNQMSMDNHDILYFLPDADIKEMDLVNFDGHDRVASLVRTYPLSNVNIVRIAYFLRQN